MNHGQERWLRLLRGFCPDHLVEEIEGDLVQKFERDRKLFGEQRAKRRLIWNVVGFLRPGVLLRRKVSIEFTDMNMIRGYFIIAWRHLLKNKTFSLINMTGLALGMAAFMLIVHYVRFERSYEDFNVNARNISRVTLDIYKGAEFVVADCQMYAPVGQILKDKFTEVIDYTRLRPLGGSKVVKRGDEKFYEQSIYFADPSVFNLFPAEVLHGKNELSAPFQVVITESIAQKYYGRTDVTGETIDMEGIPFTISGVVADAPPNTHFKYNFLLSHTTMNKIWDYEDNQFNGNNEFTYLLMATPMDLVAFNNKLEKLSVEMVDKIGDDRMVAESMKDIHLYSNKSFDMETNGSAQTVYFLGIIAAFVLFIAWINYINLSTARATERAREVGIRKVMGSMRSQLVVQFLSESIIVTFFAALICLVFIYTCLPIFINLTGQRIPADVFRKTDFWIGLSGLLMMGSLLAGFYPAFALSSFRPALVLKGKYISSSGGQWLRKGLVVFQFTTTVVLIVGMGVVYFQVNYLQNYKLGMNVEQTLVIRAPAIKSDSLFKIQSEELKKELLRNSSVERVSHSGTLPGMSLGELSTTGNVLRPGQEKNDKGFIYYINAFDEDFIPLFQMKLAAGRNFNPGTSGEYGLIINEEAMHALGFESPEAAVGSEILFYNNSKTIIGVLRNFYQRSPKEKIIPMVFWCDNRADYFSIKIKPDHFAETVAEVRQTWRKLFPENPFDYFFLDETYRQQYSADLQFGQVIAVFCVLTALIACLGLFGLSSFTILQRRKEIGIRKVLGASVNRIVRLLSQDFVVLVLIACLIALPAAYVMTEEWLSNYPVRFTTTAWIFVVPLGVILLIAFLTVSVQTIRAAQMNPVDTLKE